MRIVFFDFVIHFGGAPQLAADTAKRLAAEHNVQVVDAYGACPAFLEVLEKANIRSHVLVPETRNVYIGYRGNKLRRLWRMACQIPVFLRLRHRLVQKIREIDPDVIWTNGHLGLLLLSMSPSLRHYSAVKYVCGCSPAASIGGLDRWLMGHRASRLMAISTETARQLRLAGLSEDRIDLVFDTIDLQDTLKRSIEPLEAPLPGLDKRPRILLPATLLRTKGQHAAIKAVGKLKSDSLDPALWLAGDTVGNDLTYEQYLHGLVDELGLAGNVHFLGWRSDIPAIIAHSDIVVLPTHTEGFGHVILEAMLLRRPVAATHVGGTKDSIEDGINGLVFPVDDDEALAAQLKRLVKDRRLVSVLVDNGYETVTERFSPELHTKRVAEALACAARSVSR